MRYIGDVHGKWRPYKKIIAAAPASIQVGDLGVGFRRISGYRAGEFYSNAPHYAMVEHNARFIRGNHDNPAHCRSHSQWVPDGYVEGDIFYIGGAASVDKEWRVPDYSWWAEEELSHQELDSLVTKFLMSKPRVMVTHDCPQDVSTAMCQHWGVPKWKFPSRTAQALQAMLSAHSPQVWIFGHWHRSFDHILAGTRFICLAELEYIDL